MDGMLTTQELGILTFDVLRNDFHRPFVNGKCNRENIDEQIMIGILSGQLSSMNEADVKFVCDIIDDLIIAHSEGTL